MKKAFLMLVLLSLCLLGCAHAEPCAYAVVSNPNAADRLNLRAGPSADTPSLGKYYNGTQVKVVENTGDGWLRVQIGASGSSAYEGYMDGRFVNADSGVVSAAPLGEIRNAFASEQVLLSAPSSQGSELLCFLPNGTPVTVLGYTEDFYHVQAAGCAGFAPVSSVELSAPSDSTANLGSGGDANPAALFSDTTVQPMDCGWTQTATLTESSNGRYAVCVFLQTNNIMMNDVILSYNLYLNGQYFGPVAGIESSAGGYLNCFAASFAYDGELLSADLRPVYEKSRDETTNSADFIHLTAS
ncbi:MAG: SH3 domain-containing protein [Eubacteriales bacterium]|nr:SH3 domain-containing protein [Eubacteriales bacterium]